MCNKCENRGDRGGCGRYPDGYRMRGGRRNMRKGWWDYVFFEWDCRKTALACTLRLSCWLVCVLCVLWYTKCSWQVSNDPPVKYPVKDDSFWSLVKYHHSPFPSPDAGSTVTWDIADLDASMREMSYYVNVCDCENVDSVIETLADTSYTDDTTSSDAYPLMPESITVEIVDSSEGCGVPSIVLGEL